MLRGPMIRAADLAMRPGTGIARLLARVISLGSGPDSKGICCQVSGKSAGTRSHDFPACALTSQPERES